jgi:hypothetical protein
MPGLPTCYRTIGSSRTGAAGTTAQRAPAQANFEVELAEGRVIVVYSSRQCRVNV